jgi:hypothetical protein
VPTLLPSAFAHPLAPHWGDWALEPALTMTASIAGSLHLLRFDHPWRDAPTACSLRELDREPPDDAHVLRFALRLLDAIGDDRRLEGVAAAIPAARWYRSDPRSAEYGVTPLQLSPSPAFARATFGDELVDAHLDALAAEQQPDGGWPVTWQPPGDGARREWRGNRTVDALRLLREYGRL